MLVIFNASTLVPMGGLHPPWGQVAARSPPPRGVSPPRPTVLNFEQCVDLSGFREETQNASSDDEQESDVWLELGLVEMPDSPRSEESTHSRRSSASTVTILSEEPGTTTTPFCDRIAQAGGGGGRSPSTSCSEHGSTGAQPPPPPRPTTHTTEAGIGAPRPHAVKGIFPRAPCLQG